MPPIAPGVACSLKNVIVTPSFPSILSDKVKHPSLCSARTRTRTRIRTQVYHRPIQGHPYFTLRPQSWTTKLDLPIIDTLNLTRETDTTALPPGMLGC